MTVWAWVSKDNAAYFANLMTGHQEISARLRAIPNCAGHARGRRRKKEAKIDHGVGLEFHKRIGDRVEKGESLATIHYNSDAKLAEASSFISASDHVGERAPREKRPFIHRILGA